MDSIGICQWAGEQLRPHFKALVEVAAAGLRDGSAKVRTAALSAVATLVQWVAEEPEVRCFRELVPSMLQVLRVLVYVRLPHSLRLRDTKFLLPRENSLVCDLQLVCMMCLLLY
jgi:hypothetical protein